MRKALAGIAIVLGLVAPFSLVAAAHADEPKPKPTAGIQSGDDDYEDHEEFGEIDHDAEDRMHNELEERYGKGGAFAIPPLVIRPHGGFAGHANGTTATLGGAGVLTGTGTDFSGANVSGSGQSASVPGSAFTPNGLPASNASTAGVSGTQSQSTSQISTTPIDFSKVQLNSPTPAETFMQWATGGIAVMAALAIALAATVGRKALRSARQDAE